MLPGQSKLARLETRNSPSRPACAGATLLCWRRPQPDRLRSHGAKGPCVVESPVRRGVQDEVSGSGGCFHLARFIVPVPWPLSRRQSNRCPLEVLFKVPYLKVPYLGSSRAPAARRHSGRPPTAPAVRPLYEHHRRLAPFPLARWTPPAPPLLSSSSYHLSFTLSQPRPRFSYSSPSLG